MKQEQIKEEAKCTCKEHDPYCCQVHGICPTCVKQEKPKQETRKNRLLEEQIEEEAHNWLYELKNTNPSVLEKRYPFVPMKFGFIEGVKWQAERMYSEEDMRLAYYTDSAPWSNRHKDYIEVSFDVWIEQFKKNKDFNQNT